MATETHTVVGIFADARFMHSESLRLLEAGDLRDAAEKAWCATKRATDALILRYTGREPRTSGVTYRNIRGLRHQSPDLESLANRYSQRMQDLHGSCFYDGVCEPEEPTIQDIHATAAYIDDAERLAGA